MRGLVSKGILGVLFLLFLGNSLGIGAELGEFRSLGTKAGTPEQMRRSRNHNLKYLSKTEKFNLPESPWTERREFSAFAPVAETDSFMYLIMSSDMDFNSEEFKALIAKNLPSEMKLILIAATGSEEKVLKRFGQWIPKDRVEILSLPTAYWGTTLWARDWIPMPVYRNQLGEIGLVSTLYEQHGDVHAAGVFKDFLADRMKVPINKRNFYFVGGNLQSTSEGHCFSVQSQRLFELTETTLKKNYGCRKVTILPHISGIGDVDEVLKLLPNQVILTNHSEYVGTLENLGYRVVLLPPVENNVSSFGYREMGTYVNSVILGNRVFMPVYGQGSDSKAMSVYEKLGYQVFAADSRILSFRGLGSFHCLTMSYPKMEIQNIAKLFGASVYTKTR